MFQRAEIDMARLAVDQHIHPCRFSISNCGCDGGDVFHRCILSHRLITPVLASRLGAATPEWPLALVDGRGAGGDGSGFEMLAGRVSS